MSGSACTRFSAANSASRTVPRGSLGACTTSLGSPRAGVPTVTWSRPSPDCGLAGSQLGVISNWDGRLEGLLGGLGLAKYFDTVVSSACVGLHKPDPRIFELACTRLGVAPEEAAHVGDHHYADIVGATAVGMMPVLIDRFDGVDDGAERFVRTLDDLECVLGLEE